MSKKQWVSKSLDGRLSPIILVGLPVSSVALQLEHVE